MIRTTIGAGILVAGLGAAEAQGNWQIFFPPIVVPGVSDPRALANPAWIFLPNAERPAAMAGLRLLYDIGTQYDVDQHLAALIESVRAALTSAPAIPHERFGVVGNSIELTIGGLLPATEAQLADARTRLEPLRNALPVGGFEFDLSMSGGFVRFTYSEAGLAHRTAELLDATIAAIGRRLAAFDVQAIARSQGDDRIVLTLAGPDAAAAQAAIARADDVVSLHLVTQTLLTGAPDPLPPGLVAVPDTTDPATVYLMDEAPIVGFEGFATADVERDQNGGGPVVVFSLTAEAARAFAQTTSANVGRTLAIVVEGRVVSAPIIQSAILGGTGVITGNFDMAEATALVEAIRAGGLPAPVTLAETRTVTAGWPASSPTTDASALAVEFMTDPAYSYVDPGLVAAGTYAAGFGKAGVQFLDGDGRSFVLTMPVPPGGAAGRSSALAFLRKQFELFYAIRAVWELGPVLVLDPEAGFVPGM